MLDKHELKYKEYLKLYRRYNQLWDQVMEFPLVKLKEPYQQGWKIEYDVREDIKRRKDYDAIKKVLAEAYYPRYTNNVKVVRAIRRKEDVIIKSRWNSVHISSYYPQRHYVSQRDYNKMSADVAKYFELDTWSQDYQKGWKRYYIQLPKYWLVLKVRPNIITHRRSKGGPVEKEYQELRARLWGSAEFMEFRIAFRVDLHKSYPAHKDRARTRDKINKFKNGDVDDIINEKVKMEYYY